ncbi:hypothetical protein WJX81_002814 [Elliptochloris bilobata]|uniref:Large ribosomal subunit protein mL46 N-terminal domain-containing protein n=1 Tax=Elliptochloris bilobata TaxID=381761 RepID=A0AAW1RKN2_9CHLO
MRTRISVREASSVANSNVIAAIILERLPVITPDLPAWEVEYQEWKQARDYTFRQPMPMELTEMRNLGGAGGEEEEDEDDDDEEEEEEEDEDEEGGSSNRKQRYEPAPRRTAADEFGDVRSLERALDQRLFMLVRTAGKGGRWRFPQTAQADGETMRAAAQRALEAALAPNPELQTWFVGRSPCMHHPAAAAKDPKTKPSKSQSAEGAGEGGGGSCGTLFFHRAQLITGVPALRAGSGFTDYAWLTKAELGTRLEDAALVEQLHKAL